MFVQPTYARARRRHRRADVAVERFWRANRRCISHESQTFEIEFNTSLLLDDALEHFAQLLFALVAHPALAFFVIVEVEATGHRRQPQLTQRLLAAEDQLAAVFELDGQHTGRAFQVDVQVAFIKDVFQFFLGLIDQIVETGFGQTHCGNLKNCLIRLKRRKIRTLPADCKG